MLKNLKRNSTTKVLNYRKISFIGFRYILAQYRYFDYF